MTIKQFKINNNTYFRHNHFHETLTDMLKPMAQIGY